MRHVSPPAGLGLPASTREYVPPSIMTTSFPGESPRREKGGIASQTSASDLVNAFSTFGLGNGTQQQSRSRHAPYVDLIPTHDTAEQYMTFNPCYKSMSPQEEPSGAYSYSYPLFSDVVPASMPSLKDILEHSEPLPPRSSTAPNVHGLEDLTEADFDIAHASPRASWGGPKSTHEHEPKQTRQRAHVQGNFHLYDEVYVPKKSPKPPVRSSSLQPVQIQSKQTKTSSNTSLAATKTQLEKDKKNKSGFFSGQTKSTKSAPDVKPKPKQKPVHLSSKTPARQTSCGLGLKTGPTASKKGISKSEKHLERGSPKQSPRLQQRSASQWGVPCSGGSPHQQRGGIVCGMAASGLQRATPQRASMPALRSQPDTSLSVAPSSRNVVTNSQAGDIWQCHGEVMDSANTRPKSATTNASPDQSTKLSGVAPAAPMGKSEKISEARHPIPPASLPLSHNVPLEAFTDEQVLPPATLPLEVEDVEEDAETAGVKKLKQRCQTPPRVLASPTLDNIKCEVIADI